MIDKQNCYSMKANDGTIYYFKYGHALHRLDGPAIEWYNGFASYSIDNIAYMNYNKYENKLTIFNNIKQLSEYIGHIRENIIIIIIKYNPKIEMQGGVEFPNFIKNLIII